MDTLQKYARLREICSRLPASDREVLMEIYDHMVDIEDRVAHLQAIVNGTWENADQIIALCRQKINTN